MVVSPQPSMAVDVISAVPPQTFSPTVISRREGRPVVRSPEQLRLHRALEEINWTGELDEFNDAVRLPNLSVTQPILVTPDGTILAGFGRWRSAVFEGRDRLDCIEYPFDSDEALQFILSHQQPRGGWNDFTRIRLALTLEPNFQQRALYNMRVGGKYKGLANLPDAQIDVRQEIARVARVGTRNVGNVKKILQTAHPRLIDALQDGTLTINRAIQWCGFEKAQQLEKFTDHICDRETNKVIRQAIGHPESEKNSFDSMMVLNTLQQQERLQPGSVSIRVGRLRQTIILIGQDLLLGLNLQKELNLP